MIGRFLAVAAVVLAVLLGSGWSPAFGAKVYRWVDENGTVHYSDQPVEGAARLEIEAAPAVDIDLPPPRGAPADRGSKDVEPPADYRVAFANLSDGEVIWNDARELPLELEVDPPLAAGRGHRLVVYLDGEARARLAAQTTVRLSGIVRGPHEVRAEIVDGDGRRLASTPRLTIYHRQHSRSR